MEENHAAGQSRDTLQRPLPTPNTYTLTPLQNTFYLKNYLLKKKEIRKQKAGDREEK